MDGRTVRADTDSPNDIPFTTGPDLRLLGKTEAEDRAGGPAFGIGQYRGRHSGPHQVLVRLYGTLTDHIKRQCRERQHGLDHDPLATKGSQRTIHGDRERTV